MLRVTTIFLVFDGMSSDHIDSNRSTQNKDKFNGGSNYNVVISISYNYVTSVTGVIR